MLVTPQVYQSQQVELKAGDKVLWHRNFKDENIRNGQRASLQSIEKDHLIFRLEDGQEKTLSKDNAALKHIDHGYVLTNYKVQGKDASYAVGLMASHHRFSATLKNFYVQISRAVHEMTLVTDDKVALITAIGRNKDEKLASLDIVSSERLKMHEAQFNYKNSLSLSIVIERQRQFEEKSVLRAQPQTRDINYILRNKLTEKTINDAEKVKELER